MSNAIKQESPLVHVDITAHGLAPEVLTLEEQAFHGHTNLRGRVDDAVFMSAAEKVLGVALPVAANTFVTKDDIKVFWLGPDEWLIVTPPDHQTKIQEALRLALQETFFAVTDVTGAQTILTVSGSAARDFLSAECPLDIHPRVFKPGDCAQTHLAKATALIYQVDDKPTYGIIFRRSFADYLGRWMLTVAGDFA